MRFFIALFFSATIQAVAQSPEVPHKMQFAGMTLTIRDDARREIQKDVDAMTASPRHFNIKVERARTYFPIIEKIFAEEGVPDDFKYLSLQESALIADAVSVSNAVGFWQFKEFTAVEMGLRVDKEVDERLNIASASRGAARYIKRNNMMFNNWIFALQAYQMGAGGVMQSVKETHSGATHMEITSKTYWYVKKYLAHKVAYENSVGGKGQISLLTLENKTRRSLSDLSKEMSVNEAELVSYNKWAKRGVIPDDRTYLVVIPVTSETPVNPNLIASAPSSIHSAAKSPVAVPAMSASGAVRVNGIATIIASQGDTPTKLATRAGVDLSAFLKWNDLSISDAVQPGQRLLLGKKRARSTEAYHKVRTGETLWSVSQLYGVQMKKLRKYNRMSSNDEALTPGTTLWLSSMRPRESNKTVNNAAVVQIDQQETFAWETAPAPVAVVTPPPPVQNTPVIPQNTAQDTVKNTPVTPAPMPAAVVEDTTANVKTADVATSTPDSVQTLQVPPPTVPEVKDSVATIAVTPPPPKKNTHVVQAKETLYGIAKQYNLAVMDLVRWNNLDLQQGIHPGQVIKLTDPQPVTEQPVAAAQPTQIIHEVKPSDTLYSVARKYGVTIKELMDWNGKKDFSLSTGEKLKVFQK
jgi:membrane-bound lytic murein transglycosylase D